MNKSVARNFVHIGDAGDRGHDGAGAGDHRHLWRDFLYTVSQRKARNWNSFWRSGAQSGDVVQMVLRQGARLALVGRGDWNRRRFGIDSVDEELAVWRDGTGSAGRSPQLLPCSSQLRSWHAISQRDARRAIDPLVALRYE